MLRGRRQEDQAWRHALDVAASKAAYGDRLDALLALVGERTGLPSRHLYLADEGSRRIHLERSSVVGPATTLTAGNEGGAEAAGPTPQAELPRGDEDRIQRVVRTAAGPMLATPLVTGSRFVGAVLAGPVDDTAPSATRLAVAELADAIAFAVDAARREELQRRELVDLRARLDTGRRLQGSALELDAYLALLLDLARSATGSDGGFVAIVGADGRPAVRVETGLPDGFALDLDPDDGVFDWAPAADGGALLLRDFEAVLAQGVRSILAVPLLDGNRPLGIFSLVNLDSGGQFDVEALDLLAAFAEQARLMLGNAQLFDQFVDRYLGTLRGLARALDARRPWTHGHHDAVVRIAVTVALELGLDPAEVEAIRTAADIHDVGMAGMATDHGAWSADVEHTAVATSLVEHLPLHPAVAPAIATHHEWYDGWGLPNGLRGDDIPIGGRIIGLAVVATELLAGDPLRAPFDVRQVIAELEQRAGSQFDPRVVAAATRVLPGLGLDNVRED